MLALYQFPISHFCEKARCALEYKQLEYKKVTLLPGLHVKKAKKLASKSSLPILVHDKNVINESSEIISYLDQTFPQNMLTPKDEGEKKKPWSGSNLRIKSSGQMCVVCVTTPCSTIRKSPFLFLRWVDHGMEN